MLIAFYTQSFFSPIVSSRILFFLHTLDDADKKLLRKDKQHCRSSAKPLHRVFGGEWKSFIIKRTSTHGFQPSSQSIVDS